ncbi:hypothetical protein HK405_011600, partial [Cladochytrium tenue]
AAAMHPDRTTSPSAQGRASSLRRRHKRGVSEGGHRRSPRRPRSWTLPGWALALVVAVLASVTAGQPQSDPLTASWSPTSSPVASAVSAPISSLASSSPPGLSSSVSASETSTSTAAAVPTGLDVGASEPFSQVYDMPFYSITSIGLENNWIMAIGSTKPNYKNVTNTTGTAYDQVWAIRANTTGPGAWQWAWSSSLLANSSANSASASTLTTSTGSQSATDNTSGSASAETVAATTAAATISAAVETPAAAATYAALAVKHITLQVPQSQLFLLDNGAAALQVLTYGWSTPRVSPDAAYPPRAVPVGWQPSAVSALDSSFGMFVARADRVAWVQASQAYTAGAPTSASNASDAGSWPHVELWPGDSWVNATAASSTATARLVLLSPQAYPSAASVIAVWLATDLAHLYVLSRNSSAPAAAPVFNVHRYAASGPDTDMGAPPARTGSAAGGPALPGEPVASLNSSTIPALASADGAGVSGVELVPTCLAVHPRTQQLLIGLSPTASTSSAAAVLLVLDMVSGSSLQAAPTYVARRWVRTGLSVVRAIEVDNEGTRLFLAGDRPGAGGGLDLLDVSAAAAGFGGSASSTATWRAAANTIATATAAVAVAAVVVYSWLLEF